MLPSLLDDRDLLAARLYAEGRPDLAEPLERCGDPVQLTCTNCGASKDGHHHCDRKYCPSCARILAAKRTARIRNAAAEFRWPLFVTLTVQNSPDPESIRTLREDFGKLRRRVIWKNQVKGGVAALEVTNKGNGWHPHIHALIDCEWLAVKTPPPPAGSSPDTIAKHCRSAASEFGATWSAITGTDHAQIFIRRTQASTAVEEVLKYALKADEVLAVKEPLGPLLDVLSSTRTVTTFGSLFGRGAEFDEAANTEKPPCECCGESGHFVPPAVLQFMMR